MNKKHLSPIKFLSVTMIGQFIKRVLTVSIISLALCTTLFAQTDPVRTDDDPATIIENTINTLLAAFSERHTQLNGNNRDLFDLVDRVASPLFDFNYISKLVLAKNWKKASAQQRKDFANEFKRLIIITYATALFQYTGNETITFNQSEIKEKKGAKFGTVNTEIHVSEGTTILVSYFLIQREQQWKIYNLTVGNLNMVLNYRNIFRASVLNKGLDGMISDMKNSNDKHYSP